MAFVIDRPHGEARTFDVQLRAAVCSLSVFEFDAALRDDAAAMSGAARLLSELLDGDCTPRPRWFHRAFEIAWGANRSAALIKEGARLSHGDHRAWSASHELREQRRRERQWRKLVATI